MEYLTKFLIVYSILCTLVLFSTSVLCNAMCFVLGVCRSIFKNVRKYTKSRHTELAHQPLSNDYVQT